MFLFISFNVFFSYKKRILQKPTIKTHYKIEHTNTPTIVDVIHIISEDFFGDHQ